MNFNKKVSVVIGTYTADDLESIISEHLENDYQIQDSSVEFYCGRTECVYVFVKKEK